MRRWLRCLVCLLVICALLINLSPLRVKATGVTAGGVVVGVGITVAVAAALNALGVRQGSDSSSFFEIVNSCADALSSRFATDGLVTFLSLTQNGVGKTYASANFLQGILDWIFANEVVISGVSMPDTASSSEISKVESAADSPYAFLVVDNSSGWCFIGSDTSPFDTIIDDLGNHFIVSSVSGRSFNFSYRGGSWTTASNITYDPSSCTLTFFGTALPAPISTTQDLTLESVGQDVDTDYKTYVDTGVVDIEWGVHFEENGDGSDDDNGDGMIGVPVRIPDLSTDSFTDQTQEEAQTGDTPQEILDQLLQQLGGGGSGSGTGDGTGSGNTGNSGNTWVPPSSHTQFALADLSKYFPFCIPFDLFDFFTLLDADPVAPVLSWEIQDLSGQTYALSVNLSEWDSVAQLFRRLQLFLFICGLAAASRKYIKW